MISFETDYIEGCHPAILEAFGRTNMEQVSGYGYDKFCDSAKEKIKEACGCPEGQVYLLNGGTQTNQIVIDTMLEPFEGVLAAETGHVNVHEAGAIEFSGHKVLTLPAHDGKVAAEDVKAFAEKFYADGTHEHMVFPGMVYISHPSEFGTLYSAAELRALSEVCHEYNMPLYLDGARLAYALESKETDVTLPMIAELTDVFYIGGTKCGSLNGEALVFPKGNAPSHFETRIKQHGAMFAKGRIVGVQFDTLFSKDENGELLYTKIGRNAIDRAEEMKAVFKENGISFYMNSPTNQQFVILENNVAEKLAETILYSIWEPYNDTQTLARFVTDWATTPEAIQELNRALMACGK